MVTAGTLLGLLVTTLNLLGMGAALGLLSAPAPPHLPWPALGTVTAACALVAVPTVVLAARGTHKRSRPIN